jgi:predicted DNA-binding transcriptional regulator AlpA
MDASKFDLLTAKVLREMFKISTFTWQKIRDVPGFPEPIRLHPKGKRMWRKSEIEEYLKNL